MTTQIRLIDFARSYTAAEFEALPDDGNRYELIKGRLVMTPPPAGDDHGTIIDRLTRALHAFDPDIRLGEIWTTTGFMLNANTTLEPDLMFVVNSRRPPRGKGALRVIPDLVVEVWSPSQITRQGLDQASQDKIKAYQEAGVPLIWSVNPDNQTVSVYHPAQPDPVATLSGEDELDGEAVLPGFKLVVKRLF